MAEKTIVAGIPLDQQPSQEEINDIPRNPHEELDIMEVIDTIITQAPVRNQSAEKLQLVENNLKQIWKDFEVSKDKKTMNDSITLFKHSFLDPISDEDIDNSSRLVIEDIIIKMLQESNKV